MRHSAGLNIFCFLALTAMVCAGASYGAATVHRTVQLGSSDTRLELTRSDTRAVAMDFELGELNVSRITTSEGEYNLLSAPGLARSTRVGEPALPTLGRLICVPLGADISARVVNAVSEDVSLADLDLPYPVLPAQAPVSKSDDTANLPFVKNDAVYQRAGYYTLPPVKVEILGVMRSVRLARVTIAPVEYNPTENKLRVYSKVSVQLDFNGADEATTSALLATQSSPVFDAVLNELTNYPSFASVYNAPTAAGATTYPIKYLIVADRMFESQLDDFIDWKTRRGFEVVTAYTDVIGSTSGAIRGYIQDLYNAGTPQDPAPSYVLLVGDAEQIPPFDGATGSHVTDLYFAEFTGDFLPDMYYGRFSAQTPEQLQPQLDKTLEYEQYLMPDPGYLANVTLVAGVDPTYAEDYANGQINYGANLYFNVAHGFAPNIWLYPDSDDPSAAGDILQTISDGVGLYNYTAHCSHPGQADPSFTTGDFGALNNLHKYLLAIGNCCAANSFGADYSSPCFGEVFLQAAEKGGIGYVGASDNTFWDEDYYWAVGAGPVLGAGPSYEQTTVGSYDNLFHEHGEPTDVYSVTNGAIQVAGNLAVAASASSMTSYYWEVYHLMGDPSVMTYLGVPVPNDVVFDHELPLSAASLLVTAEPGSYVGLSQNGQVLGAGVVGSSGSATIPFLGIPELGSADLVATGQNRIPYTDNFIFLTPSAPYVIFDSSHVDDATGNADGFIDAGEQITLGIQVVNAGSVDAEDCTATLTCDDPFISVTDPTATYGNVAGDLGTVYVADAFTFDVSPSVPDQHVVTFTLEVTGQGVWQSTFESHVRAPRLGYVSYAVDDAVGGDADNQLEAGETALLSVAVVNNGSGPAEATNGFVTTSDSYLSINDGDATYGYIAPNGGTADNVPDPFEVYVAPDCPAGHAATLQLLLREAGDHADTLEVTITVGERVVLVYDDFTVNQGWSGLGGLGEWTIGAVQGYGGDPALDHSPGNNNRALGNDLTAFGTYGNNLPVAEWVYSPVYDCSHAHGVTLSYYRWLGVQSNPNDLALFEVFNGSQWVSLFVNGPTLIDNDWQLLQYDLAAAADGNAQLRFRFAIGPTDHTETYCGWNVDDFTLLGFSENGVPDMVLSAISVTDSVQIDSTACDTLWIRNPAAVPLTVWLTTARSWLHTVYGKRTVAAGDSSAVVITVDAGDVQFGDNTGVIEYASNAPDNLVGAIDANFHKLTPQLMVDSTELHIDIRHDDTASVFFTITNAGPGRLDFHVEEIQTYPLDIDWLTVLTTDSSLWFEGSAPVHLFVDAAGFRETTGASDVTITTNDPNNPALMIPVVLSVDTSCCEGWVGDANGVGGDMPTIGDINLIIDVLYIQSGATLPCLTEADANLSGHGHPTMEDITIGDINMLIDIIYITGGVPDSCP